MIVCFGSINLDLIFPLPHLPAAGETVLGPAMTIEPGGKGANQAVAAVLDGARVVFAGAVGADALAHDALRLMRGTNMDTSRIATAATATGCAAICVDPDGRNMIAVASGANLAARQDQVEDALLGQGTTLLLQMEVRAGEIAALIRRGREAGCRIILNLAPAAPLDEPVLRALDLLVLNEGEAGFLAEWLGCAAEAASLRARLGGVGVVVTLGENGVEAASGQGDVRLLGHPVQVVDTTGAGDCFTGVLAASLDRGMSIRDALVRANVAAALCCSKRGTQGSMPRATQTEAAIRK